MKLPVCAAGVVGPGILAAIASFSVAACGSSPMAPTAVRDDGPRPAGQTVRGGERLSWDQPGPSAVEVTAYQYKLYVDGQQTPLADVQCAGGAVRGQFPCAGVLPVLPPGPHVLELSATARGVESPLSAPLSVMSASADTSESVAVADP